LELPVWKAQGNIQIHKQLLERLFIVSLPGISTLKIFIQEHWHLQLGILCTEVEGHVGTMTFDSYRINASLWLSSALYHHIPSAPGQWQVCTTQWKPLPLYTVSLSFPLTRSSLPSRSLLVRHFPSVVPLSRADMFPHFLLLHVGCGLALLKVWG
jgi:hypothetical protein